MLIHPVNGKSARRYESHGTVPEYQILQISISLASPLLSCIMTPDAMKSLLVFPRQIAVLFFACLTISPFAQTAPTLSSVTPADGATQVATTTPLVFVFDQAMDTNVFLIASSAGLVGTYELTAPNFNQVLAAEWTNDRTITITPFIQFPYATFTWTLNPPGSLTFFRLKSKAGVELAAVSGTFTTGIPTVNPALGSSVPANNASGVAINTTVEFRFNTPMRKDIPAAVSWTGTGLDPAKFIYSWSIDGRILYCDYATNFPKTTAITWVLNPAAAPTKLESATGLPLPVDTFTGSFFTSAANPDCNQNPFPITWGSYGVSKRSDFVQTSSADPAPGDEEASFVFTAFVMGGTAGGGAITAASFTPPSGSAITISNLFGTGTFFDMAPDEAALNTAYPPGAYTIRFTRTPDPERVITMTMPPNAPPIPRIVNFTEAQSINAGADFTLQWNGFTGADADDFISLYIMETNGAIVFQAPDLCVPRPLPVTATSIVIPANTLSSNRTYNAGILYGGMFYFSTNAVPQMAGSGAVNRSTRFTVSTGAGGGGTNNPPTASIISDVRLLPNGNPQFTLTGTVGATYRIERTGNLANPSWQSAGLVVITAAGNIDFEDTQNPKTFPLFYRAVSVVGLPK